MKVFPALVIIVMAAGFCRAKHLGDTSSARYRCPVKDKIVRNRYNAFEVIRDIRNWRKCGKNIHIWGILKFISILFQEKSVTELMVMVTAMAIALFGASTMRFAISTLPMQIKSRLICPVPSVEKEDVRSNISKKIMEMTNNRINIVFRCTGILNIFPAEFVTLVPPQTTRYTVPYVNHIIERHETHCQLV